MPSMQDQSYYVFTARKIVETESVLGTSHEPPKKLVKKLQEMKAEEIARILWNDWKTKEGTRLFVQPEDLIDRPNKPDTTFNTKDQSQYPNAPEEKGDKDAPFPHRTDGAVDPEPLLHETWPFNQKEDAGFPTPGFTGQGTDMPQGGGVYQQPSAGQHGMEASGLDGIMPGMEQPMMPPQGMDALIPNMLPQGIPGLEPLPGTEPDLWAPLLPQGGMGMEPNPGDQMGNNMGGDMGMDNKETDGDKHSCNICHQGFDGDDALSKHLEKEHKVYEITWPFKNREGSMPSAVYPFEK